MKRAKRRFSILGRIQDRWSPISTLAVLVILTLFTAAAVNGWNFVFTGQWVLKGIQNTVTHLPEQKPLRGKVLVLAPHPDDETLATAGIIQDVLQHGGEVQVVFLTHGDGFPSEVRISKKTLNPTPEQYLKLGELRYQEALTATGILGIPKDHVFFLGFPDRGLTSVYLSHYLLPYTSTYTQKQAVPYAHTYKPHSPYTGKELEEQVRDIVWKFRPDYVLAPTPLDFHPDHKATAYLASRLEAEFAEIEVYYYVVHGGLEWPLPKGNHPNQPLSPPSKTSQGLQWHKYPLTPEQQAVKLRAIQAYNSQMKILGRYMLAFNRTNELLLPIPEP